MVPLPNTNEIHELKRKSNFTYIETAISRAKLKTRSFWWWRWFGEAGQRFIY